VYMKIKKCNTVDIGKIIQDTRKQITEFERSIKKAPKNERCKFKVFVRKNRTKLNDLEKIFQSRAK
jgi:uncharacterized protein (DUF4213/DUF364 family)